MQVVDTGRKGRFDKENPNYLASGATHDGAVGAMALAIQRFEALTAGEGNLSPNDTVAFTLTTGRRVPVI